MRRKVESPPKGSPVEAHERTRDYLSEEECALLLQGTPRSRYRWRHAAMLMLTFSHGLRVTALCRLRHPDVDRTHGRIWIQRIKGSLSTAQPLHADALRTLKRSVKPRGNAQLPWLFLNERGDPFTRSAINSLVGMTGVRAGLPFHGHPHMRRQGCGYALANRGYDLRLLQDYLGHRDPKHTTRSTRTAAHRFEGRWACTLGP
jgi:type 1 fimbriae regulatory protein FimB